MKLTKNVLFLATALLLAACTTTAPLPPAPEPLGDDRFLIDPRSGFASIGAPGVDTQLEAAWRHAMAGNVVAAEQQLAKIRSKNPEYLPALLLDALLDLRDGNYAGAQQTIDRVQERDPENLAARVYEAEIAFRQGDARAAWEQYRVISGLPGAPPVVAERLAQLENTLFNELYAAATGATGEESVRLLREALVFQPGAVEPRVQLAGRLVTLRRFDEARRELDPVLNTAADRPDVQEILAEIDVGRGRYQEAIVRYERLARSTRDARHEQRLEDIKVEWSAANMPAHFRSALESSAVTRSDLAILLYWTVPSVRFAQNIGVPQIAVDVEEVAGREEIIRAIALGLFEVDPITRRVSPHRTVSGGRVAQHLTRVLMLRGAPCSRGLPSDQVLAACGITSPVITRASESVVSGRDVHRTLEQVAKALQ